jgi:hypothetical protein
VVQDADERGTGVGAEPAASARLAARRPEESSHLHAGDLVQLKVYQDTGSPLGIQAAAIGLLLTSANGADRFSLMTRQLHHGARRCDAAHPNGHTCDEPPPESRRRHRRDPI